PRSAPTSSTCLLRTACDRASSPTGALAGGLMKRLDGGLSGVAEPVPAGGWDALGLPAPWAEVAGALAGGRAPRPVQALALGRQRLLEGRRNALVSAPTNAGKSLVGTLVLLEAVSRGQRAVLLEPLRAIAREKQEELQALRPELERLLGRPVRVRLSTGDYRLEDEHFASPPPGGELLIATPERLEAV